MSRSLARRIARYVHRKPSPGNPTQHRNRVNQAARKYATSERKVHAALTTYRHTLNPTFDTTYSPTMRTEWYPDQVMPT